MKITTQYTALILLLIAYMGLALIFSAAIPLSKAPDEYVHFLYTRFLVERARPPLNIQERQSAGYKSDQPPLYHALVALFTSGIDVSEPPAFKFTWEPYQRQLVDIVLPRAILVRTEDEVWPYKGLFLAWFAGRWVSIAFSIVPIVVTYFMARELFPDQPWLALAACAALAFLPRFIFTSSVLSDDNLIGLLMALFLWGLLQAAQASQPPGVGWFIMLGGLLGLALSTKYSIALAPLELVALLIWLAKKQLYPWRYGFNRILMSGLALLTISGAWFGFVIWNFNQVSELGPLLGVINPLIAGDTSDETSALISGFITGDRVLIDEATPGAAEGSLFDWSYAFFEQFWDVPVFGSIRLYPVEIVVFLALIFCLLAGLGWWQRWRRNEGRQRLWLGILLFHVLTFVPIPLLRFIVTGQIHDTAQARHVLFPAAPALAILLTAGVAGAFPAKWQLRAAWSVASFSFILAGLHLYYYSFAFPAPLPVRSDPTLADTPEQPLSVDFGEELQLRGYGWHLNNRQTLELKLYWRATNLARDDYRTEIILASLDGPARRVWFSHPANGRFPIRAWDVGDSVRDTLQIPLAGLPPGGYRLTLRMLDAEDIPLSSTLGDIVELTTVEFTHLPSIQSPTLWQAGRPATGLPVYRYRATIPLTVPFGEQTSLRGPDGKIYLPVTSAAEFNLFMVNYDWPSGLYRVLGNDLDLGLKLEVKNFERNFTPPEMKRIVEANFNNEIRLLGYDLPERRIEAGAGIPVILYWQSLRRVTKNYIIFDRLLDETQRSWGGYDRLPKETYPTYLWTPGEVVADGFVIRVAPSTPDGIYHIVIGLYDKADPTARSLPLFQAGAPLAETSVRLEPVKIGGPPIEARVDQPEFDYPVNADFGGLIRLLGYTMTRDQQALRLKFYWQGLAQTEADYTLFVHLLDETDKLVTQRDQPPANNRYPTSLWDVNEIVKGEVEIALSEVPAGRYKVVIGLYDRLTGRRLMLTHPPAGQDSLSLQMIDQP
jgi:4-amino-4-deoxy-L-arabinose transferase-like glycosyltransferase